MNKSLLRIVTFLLIPGLLVQPEIAAAFSAPPVDSQAHVRSADFQTQAFIEGLELVLHPALPSSHWIRRLFAASKESIKARPKRAAWAISFTALGLYGFIKGYSAPPSSFLRDFALIEAGVFLTLVTLGIVGMIGYYKYARPILEGIQNGQLQIAGHSRITDEKKLDAHRQAADAQRDVQQQFRAHVEALETLNRKSLEEVEHLYAEFVMVYPPSSIPWLLEEQKQKVLRIDRTQAIASYRERLDKFEAYPEYFQKTDYSRWFAFVKGDIRWIEDLMQDLRERLRTIQNSGITLSEIEQIKTRVQSYRETSDLFNATEVLTHSVSFGSQTRDMRDPGDTLYDDDLSGSLFHLLVDQSNQKNQPPSEAIMNLFGFDYSFEKRAYVHDAGYEVPTGSLLYEMVHNALFKEHLPRVHVSLKGSRSTVGDGNILTLQIRQNASSDANWQTILQRHEGFKREGSSYFERIEHHQQRLGKGNRGFARFGDWLDLYGEESARLIYRRSAQSPHALETTLTLTLPPASPGVTDVLTKLPPASILGIEFARLAPWLEIGFFLPVLNIFAKSIMKRMGRAVVFFFPQHKNVLPALDVMKPMSRGSRSWAIAGSLLFILGILSAHKIVILGAALMAVAFVKEHPPLEESITDGSLLGELFLFDKIRGDTWFVRSLSNLVLGASFLYNIGLTSLPIMLYVDGVHPSLEFSYLLGWIPALLTSIVINIVLHWIYNELAILTGLLPVASILKPTTQPPASPIAAPSSIQVDFDKSIPESIRDRVRQMVAHSNLGPHVVVAASKRHAIERGAMTFLFLSHDEVKAMSEPILLAERPFEPGDRVRDWRGGKGVVADVYPDGRIRLEGDVFMRYWPSQLKPPADAGSSAPESAVSHPGEKSSDAAPPSLRWDGASEVFEWLGPSGQNWLQQITDKRRAIERLEQGIQQHLPSWTLTAALEAIVNLQLSVDLLLPLAERIAQEGLTHTLRLAEGFRQTLSHHGSYQKVILSESLLTSNHRRLTAPGAGHVILFPAEFISTDPSPLEVFPNVERTLYVLIDRKGRREKLAHARFTLQGDRLVVTEMQGSEWSDPSRRDQRRRLNHWYKETLLALEDYARENHVREVLVTPSGYQIQKASHHYGHPFAPELATRLYDHGPEDLGYIQRDVKGVISGSFELPFPLLRAWSKTIQPLTSLPTDSIESQFAARLSPLPAATPGLSADKLSETPPSENPNNAASWKTMDAFTLLDFQFPGIKTQAADLARDMNLSESEVSAHLDFLADRGWIRKEAGTYQLPSENKSMLYEALRTSYLRGDDLPLNMGAAKAIPAMQELIHRYRGWTPTPEIPSPGRQPEAGPYADLAAVLAGAKPSTMIDIDPWLMERTPLGRAMLQEARRLGFTVAKAPARMTIDELAESIYFVGLKMNVDVLVKLFTDFFEFRRFRDTATERQIGELLGYPGEAIQKYLSRLAPNPFNPSALYQLGYMETNQVVIDGTTYRTYQRRSSNKEIFHRLSDNQLFTGRLIRTGNDSWRLNNPIPISIQEILHEVLPRLRAEELIPFSPSGEHRASHSLGAAA